MGILKVLGHCGFPVPVEGCPYFLEDVLLVFFEVRTHDAILSPSVHILGFSSPHN